jgi:lanosterol synthase/cycloartenol synthase
MRKLPCVQGEAPIDDQRLFDAVNVLLTLQNDVDGGWATYENNRGYGWCAALFWPILLPY